MPFVFPAARRIAPPRLHFRRALRFVAAVGVASSQVPLAVLGQGAIRAMASASGAGKSVAVIGATGYVGSHVTAGLLAKGYSVRGTARSLDKASWLQDLVGDSGGNLEIVPLKLGTEEGKSDAELDNILTGMDAVYFCSGFEHQEPSTIDFMVNNAVATVRAARRQKVECVVLTSSGGSTNPPGHKDETPKNEIEHWSDPEFQKANGRWSPAAKTLMEINALKEVGRNQRNEVVEEALAEGAPRLCIMNPNLILGPQLQPGPVSGNSLPWVVAILKGEKMNEKIPNDSMSIIDVRDLAALHIACTENPSASGRYFGVNRSFPWEEILAAFKAAYPQYVVPPRFEGEAKIPTQFDHTRKESLGVTLRDLPDTMVDVVAFMKSRGYLP